MPARRDIAIGAGVGAVAGALVIGANTGIAAAVLLGALAGALTVVGQHWAWGDAQAEAERRWTHGTLEQRRDHARAVARRLLLGSVLLAAVVAAILVALAVDEGGLPEPQALLLLLPVVVLLGLYVHVRRRGRELR